jgi:hypothetical protein
MTEFGNHLRKFRHRCNDSKSPHGKLTQEEFGALVGAELGIQGYTGAAVSDWERDKSKIHADDRPLLAAVIKVLYERGGIQTVREANELLKAGNYSDDELRVLIAKAEKGPSPSWPRVIVSLIRRLSDRLSVFQIWKFVVWIWVWLFAWAIIMPSLRWPFSSRESALLAVVAYAAGSILVPALIGALTNTKDNEYWREQQEVPPLHLRLYTHQGASIGFHLGYFFVFTICLIRYNLGWQSLTRVELFFAVFLVILGYAGARLIPYNLFVAYERLSLRDGWIFYVFLLLGPAWGYFLLVTYDLLLTGSLGIFIVLSSLTILLAMMALPIAKREQQ